jgi:hypothetical protein
MRGTHRSKTMQAPQFAARVAPGPTATSSRGVAFVEPPPEHGPGWHIIVADRSEARLYEADRGISRLKLIDTTRNPAARQAERDLVSGRAGSKMNRGAGTFQTLSAPGSAREALGERFARKVADLARQQLDGGDKLALVAAPKLLHQILQAMPPRARTRVARTVPRDVTHEGAAMLRTRLRTALATPE